MAQSTANPQVSILSDCFDMPPLDTCRRIWLYLPTDYGTSGERYPVLYLLDGQNIFDDATSYIGEWHVDESLLRMEQGGFSGIIVVAIDHGGPYRVAEYTPWPHPVHQGGEGTRTIDFLVHYLKPYIDEHFFTLPDPEHTGIMGASLGGLMALAAGFTHPETFGLVGALSTSYWWSEACYDLAEAHPAGLPYRIFLSTGTREGRDQLRATMRMASILQEAGLPPEAVTLRRVRHKKHNEKNWSKAFPEAVAWFFPDRLASQRP